jgi:hypothetical protein
MLLVYGDESLDGTQSRVCAVAGVIGPEEMWRELEPKWIERNGGTPFHAADCESIHGGYEGRDKSETEALYKDLSILLAESGLGGLASAQDLAAQRRAFPSPYDPPLYYQGFLDVLEAMRNAAADRGEIAELTFDSRTESQFNAGEIYSYLRQSGLYWEERLASKLSFESSSNPRVQAADLFAHEAMKELDNEVGPVKRKTRESWKCLKSTSRFQIVKRGEQYFSDPRMQPRAIQKALGFNESDYDEWLSGNRLPRCHTSLLRFLFSRRSRMTDEQLRYFNSVYGGFSVSNIIGAERAGGH